MSRDRGPIHVNRTFPVVSPLVALLQAAERIGWEGGHEAAERVPGKGEAGDGRKGVPERVVPVAPVPERVVAVEGIQAEVGGRRGVGGSAGAGCSAQGVELAGAGCSAQGANVELAGRPAGKGCSAREEGELGSKERGSAFRVSSVQGELGSKERGSAFEIVDYRCKDAVDRMRAWSRSTRTCLRRPSARQPPSAGVVERADEACSQETVVEESQSASREPTPPLWEQVGRSWYAEERETHREQVGRSWYAEERETTAETHAEKMDITFLLRNEGCSAREEGELERESAGGERRSMEELERESARRRMEELERESAGGERRRMEELEREIKRENKVLLKKVRALAAVVDYALAGLDA